MHIQSDTRNPGEIVRATIINANENRNTRPKARPGLLVAEEGGHWWVLGFTTQARFKAGRSAGQMRPEIKFPERYGLTRPSYLWGDRLSRVSKIDIGDEIGFADADLSDQIIDFAGLYGQWAEALRRAVLNRGVGR